MSADAGPLVTRTATTDDAVQVAALVHAAYRSDESRTGWTTEADLVGGQRIDPPMVRELLVAPGGVVLVADGAAGELLACCYLERRDDAAYLGLFAVRPGHQGRGTGRAMVAAAEAYVRRTWGSAGLELSVINHRHELIAWYQRLGFVRTGVEHDFPYGDERFGLPQRDDIVFVEMVKPLVDGGTRAL